MHGVACERNGQLVRVLRPEQATAVELQYFRAAPGHQYAVEPMATRTVLVELVESVPQYSAEQQLHISCANLGAVSVEEGVDRACYEWIASGPSSPTFSRPAWSALADSDEELRKLERKCVHKRCAEICKERGLAVVDVRSFQPKDAPARQAK